MKRTLWRLLWYWGPLVAYAGMIFALSSMSLALPSTLHFPFADKVIHAFEYAGLGVLLCRALALGGEGLAPASALAATVVLAALYGGSDELHQAMVPNRQMELLDFLADTAGGLAGGLVYWTLRLRRKSPGVQGPEGAA